jgi:hypothetical protein
MSIFSFFELSMIVGLSQEKCRFLYMQAKQRRRYVQKKLLISLIMSEAVDMNGRFQMQGGKNWILPK